MPRTGRGGARQGTPGKSYQNRTDLQGDQPIRATPAKNYGDRKAQVDAQRQMRLPQMGQAVPPKFNAPTQMPQEPVTAGLPIGAGPGPSMSSQAAGDVGQLLLRLYQDAPNENLRRLLSAMGY